MKRDLLTFSELWILGSLADDIIDEPPHTLALELLVISNSFPIAYHIR